MKIVKTFLTREKLEKIREIDCTFYKDVKDIEWYVKRYNRFHYAYMLVEGDREVGYIMSVPIRKQLYDAIRSGVLIGDYDVNPNMYLTESYYNYIVSCVILEEYRNKGYGKALMETLFETGRGLYICITISNNGYKLASLYMNEILKIDNFTYLFEKEVD